jgi:hypothetical protein
MNECSIGWGTFCLHIRVDSTSSVRLNSCEPISCCTNALPLICRTWFCTLCILSSSSWCYARFPALCCLTWVVIISTWNHVALRDVPTLRILAWCQPTATVWTSLKYHKTSGLTLRFVRPCKLKFYLDIGTTGFCHVKSRHFSYRIWNMLHDLKANINKCFSHSSKHQHTLSLTGAINYKQTFNKLGD